MALSNRGALPQCVKLELGFRQLFVELRHALSLLWGLALQRRFPYLELWDMWLQVYQFVCLHLKDARDALQLILGILQFDFEVSYPLILDSWFPKRHDLTIFLDDFTIEPFDLCLENIDPAAIVAVLDGLQMVLELPIFSGQPLNLFAHGLQLLLLFIDNFSKLINIDVVLLVELLH